MSVIIKTDAEKQFLSRLMQDSDSTLPHCLILKLSGYTQPLEGCYDKLLAHFEALGAPITDADIYLFENSDILLTSHKFRSAHKDSVARFLAQHVSGFAENHVALTNPNLAEDKLATVAYVKPFVRAILERERVALEKQEAAAQAQAMQAELNHQPASEFLHSISQRRNAYNKPRVLIIEDDMFTAHMVKKVLSKHAEVTCHGDGISGLKAYAKMAPHLVLLDINLPDVKGHDIIPKITAMDEDAFIVMLSGNSDKTNVLKAIELGAKGFVGKPFSKQKLLEYLTKASSVTTHTERQA